MKLSFEENTFTTISDIHAQDFAEIDRNEAKRRLDFITAKLGSEALQSVDLGL